MSDINDSGKLLGQLHLASSYERKARLAPALLAIAFAVPGALVWGVSISGWITTIIAGAGLGIVLAIGLSHLASAMGNAMQEKIWPRWPSDSPTNIRLKPGSNVVSEQQRKKWCGALRKLTGLDIEAEEVSEIETEKLIQDAVSEARARLWGLPDSSRLSTHNADYGFARNFAGMRPIWLFLVTASCTACWAALALKVTGYFWPITSTILMIVAFFFGFKYLTPYVKKRADYYAESFFAAVIDIVERESTNGEGKT